MSEVVRVSGSAAEVHRQLAALDARGQLGEVEVLRAGPAGVTVQVVLRRRPTPAPTGRALPSPARASGRRVRLGLVLAWTVGGLVVLGGAAAGVAWAMGQVVAWVAGHAAQIVGTVALAGLVLAVLGRAGVCPGVHCPGCRHR